ncbi:MULTISPECIES: flavodoxin domain-containing protein [unclassified Pseudactinotalea]|uniref:flavodoxin domain-containing protein n=1 Tax=unclassified Pseudactinotalea TaxID=2649176 RepID=UPI00128B451C|nr:MULTISPECIES: flavodoxin domain-containing protein [unclassified Pseudactinotalea]MPV51164.1 protoporphyrinogen oxidase [Pseudactinotalea sp. HY160]QGH69065.1 protoporphyrinogen oxidase [Pseudactinotalea sp. HY158]
MRVLVATASNYGSTREFGAVVGSVLSGHGHEVRTADVAQVTDLDYDAVIVGTAIYIGRPLTAARKFTARLEREAPQLPVWVFASGLKNITGNPLAPPFTHPAARPYLGSRYPIFLGRVDPDVLTDAERALISMTRANLEDRRDFELVSAWADEVASVLGAQTAASLP